MQLILSGLFLYLNANQKEKLNCCNKLNGGEEGNMSWCFHQAIRGKLPVVPQGVGSLVQSSAGCQVYMHSINGQTGIGTHLDRWNHRGWSGHCPPGTGLPHWVGLGWYKFSFASSLPFHTWPNTLSMNSNWTSFHWLQHTKRTLVLIDQVPHHKQVPVPTTGISALL